MSYTLLRGSFVIRYADQPRLGPQPDGDTVKFRPDNPGLVEALPRPSGVPPDLNGRGVSVRLEAIDALETHFGATHQELAGARAARDDLLTRLGFGNVVYFDDLPNTVKSADRDEVRGYVLSNGIDANGRVIGFVYAGDHPGPDGTGVFLDEALVDQSANAQLLAGGLVFPAFYATLPATLRTHLAAVSRVARDAGLSVRGRATADPDGPATAANLAAAEALAIWPKLFRRLVPYFGAGFTDFDGFDSWLRADPVHRDDALFLLETAEHGNMHDVVSAAGHEIRLTRWPEDFVISPDPASGDGGSKPAVVAGAVMIVAALPDPVGADRGNESVTVLNTTADPVDLAGWALVDTARGRHLLGQTLAGGEAVRVPLGNGVALGNGGDTLTLVDPKGTTVDKVDYKAGQVRAGRTIVFGR